MKKILKIVALAIFSIVIIFILKVAVLGIPSYDPPQLQFEVQLDSTKIERGKKLTLMLCANCHIDPKTEKLTGTLMLDAPPEFGKVYSQNITQDKQYGIGNWTDGELIYLLRTGIKKDGSYAPPYMAKLPKMADEDIESIVAYLRSDDQMIAADATPDHPVEPSFLTKLLCNIAWKPLPMPTQEIPLPDSSDQIAVGRYYAQNLDCFSCHSADFKTNNFLEPELSEGYFGGGNQPLNRKGQVILTANLTPHETGITNYSEAEFVRMLRFGLKSNEAPLRYPMLPYTHLTNDEASAIYKYLQTLTPIDNKVERQFYE
ncbi:MAG: c-type cytochrome [Reichenbachiella sp.]|uniref:c-type cytochrome n=1 Tax=Reichenbachiella sp. TaxID=2184521 RepID=UPI003299D5C3